MRCAKTDLNDDRDDSEELTSRNVTHVTMILSLGSAVCRDRAGLGQSPATEHTSLCDVQSNTEREGESSVWYCCSRSQTLQVLILKVQDSITSAQASMAVHTAYARAPLSFKCVLCRN